MTNSIVPIPFQVADWVLACDALYKMYQENPDSPEEQARIIQKCNEDLKFDEINNNQAFQSTLLVYMIVEAYNLHLSDMAVDNTNLSDEDCQSITTRYSMINMFKHGHGIVKANPALIDGFTLEMYDFKLAAGILNATVSRFKEYLETGK